MHIIISIITAVASILGVLNFLKRLGIEIHPFIWIKTWLLGGDSKINAPGSTVEDSSSPGEDLKNESPDAMALAALIVVGMLKQEGRISRAQKAAVISIFGREFNIDAKSATAVFDASYSKIENEVNMHQLLEKILPTGSSCFTQEQLGSLSTILEEVTKVNGSQTAQQIALINLIERSCC